MTSNQALHGFRFRPSRTTFATTPCLNNGCIRIRADMTTLFDRILIDPAVCGGKPCVRGTRIWVSLVLDLLASGMSESEIMSEYPSLTRDDILAAIAYGAEAARERIIPIPAGPLV
jgi:uncharacterized protein (DUF433 family)